MKNETGSELPIPHALDEERFRLLVESVIDYAIFMLDPKGYIATWNRGAERVKGYKPHEIIGQHFSRFYPEDVVRTGKCEYELDVAAREGRFEEEGWRLRKDGTRFWANVVITALRDSMGRLVGFAKVTRDLTERKGAEDQRVELAKAREAVRLRDEFISIASHELRTPLTTLRIQADAMTRALAKGQLTPERLGDKVGKIGSQVTRLERLITALLDVSRIEAGQLKLDPEDVDLVALGRDVVANLADELERAHCPVTIDAPRPIVGAWDRGRVDQILTNLLTNAAKYGAQHPIEISITADDTTARIAVKDHGIGIAPEHHARIFDRFERAADSKHYGGLGLGLWLSKQIVEAHGGRMHVASELGKGATFTAELPLSPRHP